MWEIGVFFGRFAVHKRFFNALYVLNIISQAIFTLLIPIGLFGAIAWLLNVKCGVDSWIYVLAILLGVLLGFYSMIKFVLSAMAGLERLEKEQNSKNKNNKTDKN